MSEAGLLAIAAALEKIALELSYLRQERSDRPLEPAGFDGIEEALDRLSDVIESKRR